MPNNNEALRNHNAFFCSETCLENRVLGSGTQHTLRGLTVAKNMSSVYSGEGFVKDARSGLEPFTYAPIDFDLAETFGGSEYFSFARPPLGWSGLIRMFGQEED